MISNSTHIIVNPQDSHAAKDAVRFLHELIESLRLLGSDFDVQVGVLPKFVHIPDEIALTYGDAFLLADQVLSAGRITQGQYSRLKEIDDVLDSMSGHDYAELWTLEAMQNGPEWKRLRSMARETLQELGMPLLRPNLDWLTYASSRFADSPLDGIKFDPDGG